MDACELNAFYNILFALAPIHKIHKKLLYSNEMNQSNCDLHNHVKLNQ